MLVLVPGVTLRMLARMSHCFLTGAFMSPTFPFR